MISRKVKAQCGKKICKHNFVRSTRIKHLSTECFIITLCKLPCGNDHKEEIVEHFLIDSVANNLYGDFQWFTLRMRHDRPVISRQFTRRSPVCISIARPVKEGVRLRRRVRSFQFPKLFGRRAILFEWNESWAKLKSISWNKIK